MEKNVQFRRCSEQSWQCNMTDILYTKKKRHLANRTISIQIKGCLLSSVDVLQDYFEGFSIENACKTGCPNYGKKWSCPPFSKSFSQISGPYSSACLLCFSTEMRFYSDIKNAYLAVKAANVTLKSLIERCARHIEDYTGGCALLSGSCRLCKPCHCKSGLPCQHPDEMRYSMEATFLNVQRLCLDFLAHRLLWYERKNIPKYTSVVSLILYNQHMEYDSLANLINQEFIE